MAYTYISYKDFKPAAMAKKILPHGKDQPAKAFCKGYISLDTETSKNEDETIGWIYQWALSYPTENGRCIVYGRRPSDLATTLYKIWQVNDLDENNKLVVYCHNMSYDYTYFSQFINQQWGHIGSILAVGPHRLISYNMDGLEFRDSLKIAQKSLANWGKDLGIKHGKLVGEIDYNVIRYQQSPLYRKDWRYMFRDIISLDECIDKQLEIWNDNIWTIPLTNTGYVRRETRAEFKKDKAAKAQFKAKELSRELYQMCRMEFAGGLTHGNRYVMDKTVRVKELIEKYGKKVTIKHRDFASHYPSQQMCGYCPSTKFVEFYNREKHAAHPISLGDLAELNKKGNAFLATITISNLHVRPGVTLPVAQQCKFYDGKIGKIEFVSDNGRILHMTGESTVTVNELDLKWLVKQYTFDYEIYSVYVSKKGAFPGFLKNTVLRFFYEKSYYKAELKKLKKAGVSEDSEEYRSMHLKMMIAKGMLNSIYGMSATDPVRFSFYEQEDGEWKKEEYSSEVVAEKLEKYYNGKNSFMNYEYGLWTTALARNELLEFVELIGYENFLYADTDSIFYISTPEIEEKIEARNAAAREKDDQNGWYTEVDGKRIYFDQFEDEEENIVEFRFLHSKCYAYVTDDGELHTTIAGVSEYGRDEVSRVKELGNIENLTPGMKFYKCGGTMTKYPKKGSDISPQIIDINGYWTEVGNFALICNSMKELHSAMRSRELTHIWEVEE